MRSRFTAVEIWLRIRLAYRSVLFLALLVGYLRPPGLEGRPLLLWVAGGVAAADMVLCFLPSKFESPGCQKQFARNYRKTGKTEILIQDNHGVMMVALVWVAFNGIFGGLRMAGILDDGFLILLCGAFSICDVICILYFCPFQTLFLKNRCCVTCRIYNWGPPMMYTPLFFVRNPWAWTILALSLAVLVRWEVTFFLHPERFSENTNEYLRCANCTEKLCAHKTQLRGLWKSIKTQEERRLRSLK